VKKLILLLAVFLLGLALSGCIGEEETEHGEYTTPRNVVELIDLHAEYDETKFYSKEEVDELLTELKTRIEELETTCPIE